MLEDAGELSSCENLNSLYQTAVYDELCSDMPRGLLGFWVSCSILTVLLLILVRMNVLPSLLTMWLTVGDDSRGGGGVACYFVWYCRHRRHRRCSDAAIVLPVDTPR